MSKAQLRRSFKMAKFHRYFFRTAILLSICLIGYFVSITNLYIYSTFAIALSPGKEPSAAVRNEIQILPSAVDLLNKNNSLVPPPLPLTSIDYISNKHFFQRGDYWVSYFKVRASKTFSGNESITLTTPTDHTLLDNIVPVVERWRGPVSCTVYAPGTDYAAALTAIQFLRQCASPLIREFVNFHVFFHRKHVPDNLRKTEREILGTDYVNCSVKVTFGRKIATYKKTNNMQFPINVARNIARETAQTHFVFPSDIELVPSEGIIQGFLEMVRSDNETRLSSPAPKVFVLPVFEIKKNVKSFPKDLAELRKLYWTNQSVYFHSHTCKLCHTIPNLTQWMNFTSNTGQHKLSVFEVIKRNRRRGIWEPFYIGTKSDPIFDERITWEGKSNKRIQAFTLCLLNYDFVILNNAFLVHQPGIKYLYKRDLIPTLHVLETNNKMKIQILPELIKLYGARPECVV